MSALVAVLTAAATAVISALHVLAQPLPGNPPYQLAGKASVSAPGSQMMMSENPFLHQSLLQQQAATTGQFGNIFQSQPSRQMESMASRYPIFGGAAQFGPQHPGYFTMSDSLGSPLQHYRNPVPYGLLSDALRRAQTGNSMPPSSGSSMISPATAPMEVIIGKQQPALTQFPSTPMGGFFQGSEEAPYLAAEPHAPQISEPAASSSAASSSHSLSLPEFLRGGPQWAIDEFRRIIRTPNTGYTEQVKQINKMVERLDSARQGLYRQFMSENDEREQKHRDRIHRYVSQMSEKAQEQFAKISALLRNPALSEHDRWERVVSLYNKLSPELRDEFEEKFRSFESGH